MTQLASRLRIQPEMMLPALLAVGDWELCGDRFYERHELYAMAWGDVHLQYLRWAAPAAPMSDSRSAQRDGGVTALLSPLVSLRILVRCHLYLFGGVSSVHKLPLQLARGRIEMQKQPNAAGCTASVARLVMRGAALAQGGVRADGRPHCDDPR